MVLFGLNKLHRGLDAASEVIYRANVKSIIKMKMSFEMMMSKQSLVEPNVRIKNYMQIVNWSSQMKRSYLKNL